VPKPGREQELFNKLRSWRGVAILNSLVGTRHVMGKGVKPDTSYRLSEHCAVQFDDIF
jgi:hypothetical protein